MLIEDSDVLSMLDRGFSSVREMALYRLGLPMDTDIESMPYNERDRFMKERERIRRRLLKMQRWGDVVHIRYDRVDYWCRTS